MMLGLLMLLSAAQSTASANCAITVADKAANARLSFEDFDQQGTSVSSARALVNRGCWSEAAEATQDYLVHGPLGTEKQQRALRFHLGQQLANAGRENLAAIAIAGARDPAENLKDATALRWNDFVRAHWAFFTKDRGLLLEALNGMKSGEGFGNRLNLALVEGLSKCFDHPYLEAVSEPCRSPPPEPHK